MQQRAGLEAPALQRLCVAPGAARGDAVDGRPLPVHV
jgi:hypothetical protein